MNVMNIKPAPGHYKANLFCNAQIQNKFNFPCLIPLTTFMTFMNVHSACWRRLGARKPGHRRLEKAVMSSKTGVFHELLNVLKIEDRITVPFFALHGPIGEKAHEHMNVVLAFFSQCSYVHGLQGVFSTLRNDFYCYRRLL